MIPTARFRGAVRAGRRCATLAVAATLVANAWAQVPAGPQGDTYESIAKLPDWSGVWVLPWAGFEEENARSRQPADPMAPPLKGEAAAVREVRQAQIAAGRPTEGAKLLRQNAETCLPTGMPNVMRYAFGIEFLFTPKRVTILLEQDSAARRIYTDGRGHDPDAVPSYLGDSIGHWENGTLVIETVGLSARAELQGGVRSSGQARVVERIRLDERGNLRIDAVVEDPVYLSRPWHTTRTYERSSVEIEERVCLDNNRDLGDGDPDLTPPGPP
jgi:hypothetical protein